MANHPWAALSQPEDIGRAALLLVSEDTRVIRDHLLVLMEDMLHDDYIVGLPRMWPISKAGVDPSIGTIYDRQQIEQNQTYATYAKRSSISGYITTTPYYQIVQSELQQYS